MAGLAEAVQGAVGQPASVRIGTVTSINPLVISAQGVPFENVGFLNGLRPVLGQAVALLGQCSESGSDPASWLVLGSITAAPRAYQSGEVAVTFAAATSNVLNVPFPQRFPSVPNVHVNINSGAGSTSAWQSRAINITVNGFDLFVYTTGGAVAWNLVPVGWTAVPRTDRSP